MENTSRIPIKNIYYMLCYAWNILDYADFGVCGTEEFDSIYNLLGRILAKELKMLIKRGQHKEYIEQGEALSKIKGRFNITASISQMTMVKQQIFCVYDDYSENNLLNQIVKSTVIDLLRNKELNKQLATELRTLSYSLNNVDYIEVNNRHFGLLHYNRNNLQYSIIMNVCKLLRSGLIASAGECKLSFARYLDEQQMHKLYERFILEYYKREYPHLKVYAKQIPWNAEGSIDMLPIMQSDIYIKGIEKTLIIDAKYYRNMTQTYHDQHTIHSGNIYQIFTYVKNEDKDNTGKISGMLLYAKTIENVVPNSEYSLGGNRFAVRALDLNQDFKYIESQFEKIIEDYL